MAPVAAVVLAIIVIIVLVAVAHGQQRAGQRRDTLGVLAAELGGIATPSAVTGAVAGVDVHLEFATRGAGSSTTSWTEITCPLPPGYPVALYLTHHGWFDAGKIERGEMVDIIIDDPPFDARYRVEGAPAELVKRLLTPEVRAYLMAHANAELTARDGRLLLAVMGWLDEVDAARHAIQVATAIATAVRTASLALDAEVPMTQGESPYRGIPDDAPIRRARAARADEVGRLELTRAQRTGWSGLGVVFFVIGLLVAMLALAHSAGSP